MLTPNQKFIIGLLNAITEKLLELDESKSGDHSKDIAEPKSTPLESEGTFSSSNVRKRKFQNERSHERVGDKQRNESMGHEMSEGS